MNYKMKYWSHINVMAHNYFNIIHYLLDQMIHKDETFAKNQCI